MPSASPASAVSPTSPATSTSPARRVRLGSGAAAVLLAVTLTTFMAAASAPTPLYAVYQGYWGFSSSVLTAVFAVYAVSLLMALLTVGSLSDHVGRRPVILGAVALETVAMAIFASADGVPALVVARVLQGFATGAATGALGAGLLDADRTRGPLINSVAPALGLAAGGLGSSLLVQYLPAPTRTVFVVLIVAFVLQGAAILLLPESAGRRAGALASLRPHVSVPAGARRVLLMVTPITVAGWALGGFYLSLGPSLARGVTGSKSIVVGGLLVSALTFSGTVAILAMRAVPALRAMRVASVLLALGVIVTLLGVNTGSGVLFFAGTVVAGLGFGTGFQGAARTLLPAAAPHERAGLMAAFYIVSYLAMSIPATVAGIAAGHLPLTELTTYYGIVLAALALAALAGTFLVRDRLPVAARPA
ncbi:MFS transporter [Streptosporangium sp. NBC_01469]|uniref:MFS transporter n=1 Tax=Streptosporangium sp. NBC_01469 TaxID=2903898 RepID=UPI002E2B81B8|nr:MFS transporter [Streptosporangium sp. NBC_01469]